MQFRIPFSGRSHEYIQEEIDVVIEVMRSGETLTQGQYQEEFQDKFKLYCEVEHAFAVTNATAALEISAQCCQFKNGDEVIIPSHTFTSSAYPFLKHGARIVWADIDESTRVVTADSIRRCITPESRAIVVPHLYGYGADMPEIMSLAKDYELIVVEDAAQSLGVKVAGRMAGSYGDFGVFSFHSHKNITTLGEGGMITVRNNDIAKIIPMIRHNGHCSFSKRDSDYWIPAMGNVDLPEVGGETIWPNNFCLGEVECAVGSQLLDRIDSINQRKRQRALSFMDALADKKTELVFHRVDSERHNYHLLAAQIGGNNRDEFIRRMAYDEGIQCVVQYLPLNRYPFYQKLGLADAECPNADSFFDNMVSFPFHDSLSDDELTEIISSTRNVLDQLKFE